MEQPWHVDACSRGQGGLQVLRLILVAGQVSYFVSQPHGRMFCLGAPQDTKGMRDELKKGKRKDKMKMDADDEDAGLSELLSYVGTFTIDQHEPLQARANPGLAASLSLVA